MTDDLARRLRRLGTATLGESGATPFPPRLRPMWPGAQVAGPAVPVQLSPGDNLALHVAVTVAPPGSVLVAAVPKGDDRGFWGEVLTTAARARRVSGLVIEGGVRDADALAAHRFPVFATGTVLRGASKTGPGEVGAPVEVCGAAVGPGDWVVGDADGLVVLPAADVSIVLEAGLARATKEEQLMSALRQGKTTLELLGRNPSTITVR